ncbi:MAG: BON domain-containing protein [Bacteroidota bacterium]|nr:BON domain-containing protein [Bacteroidota bacterium]
MKLIRNYLVLFALMSLVFFSCKPKDSDFQAKIEKSLQASPETAGVSVDVKDGTATLTGEVKDNAAKEKALQDARDVNGIKNVENHVTVTPAEVMSPPVVVNNDSALTQGVKDATKDFPTVTASVNDGVITLTGSIKRSDLKNLMMSLNTLNAKKIDNQLTIK